MYLRQKRPRFFYSPGYNAPLSAPCEFAFTVHDLNHVVVRDNSSALKRLYYRAILRPAIRRAAVVLTVSGFSRAAICEWAGVSAEKVVNVGNGVSAAFKVSGARYAQDGRPYLACIGSLKAHKNLQRLLDAFACSGLVHAVRLLVVGPVSAGLQRMVKEAGVSDSVQFLGRVDDETLASVYRGALAFLFPSLYEGFGIPVIEAMACGTPVLTSRVASLPEVAGGAAMLVDPLDVEELAAAMSKLVSDDRLRAVMSADGRRRAAEYTWEATAQAVDRALAPWRPPSTQAGAPCELR
jgi:glycosyltransferase involved in cell wall biosynthesis